MTNRAKVTDQDFLSFYIIEDVKRYVDKIILKKRNKYTKYSRHTKLDIINFLYESMPIITTL